MEALKVMPKYHAVWLFGLCLSVLAGMAIPLSAAAAQFSADLTIAKKNKTVQGKIFVRGENYRMELHDGDKTTIVLVDPKAGLTRVLAPSKKEYLEMEIMDLRSVMNNPFLTYQVAEKDCGSEDVGKEIVGGYQCTQRLVKTFNNQTDFLTAWVSDKLGFYIKIVNHLRKGEFTELTNIQEGPQDEQLFRPPAGYAKMEPPKEEDAGTTAAGPSGTASGKISSNGGASAIMFILDASGSMWGQVQGKAKIAIAKEVMTELIGNLPDTARAGLVAYGHRRKGDCKDVEELVPLQPVDKKALADKIKSISPKGKTPIGASLLGVAETLKGKPGQNTIILVTDGIESCGYDPCKVAKQLAASNVVAKIHVVGFDLTGEAMDQLKCITAPSGGVLVGANSAEELKSALNEVVTAALPHNLIVRGLDSDKKPLFVSVKVFKDGQQVAGSAGGAPRYSLPAGSYRIEVRYSALDQTIVMENVTVEENRLTEKEAVFAPGTLKITSLDGDDKALYSSAVVYQAGAKQKLKNHNGSVHVFTLTPGTYDVEISNSATKTQQWLRQLEITAGGTLEKVVVFAQGNLTVESLDGNDKALYTSATVYNAGTSDQIKSTTGAKHRFTLLPGAYDVKVNSSQIKEDKWLRNIALKANDNLEHQVRFALGKIKITAFGTDGKKLYLGVEVFTAGGNNRIHFATGGGPTFTLKPGAYDIHIRAGEIKQEKWLRNVAIQNGDDIDQKVQF